MSARRMSAVVAPVLALIALLPHGASARSTVQVAPGWILDRWTTDDGLPSNAMYSAAIDDGGRLVLGTTDGLVFFDGRSFETQRIGDADGCGSASATAGHEALATRGSSLAA